MDRSTDLDPVGLTYLDDRAQAHTRLVADVRAGLSRRPYTLPPKYFYDGEGSRLFEQITQLPEYYQTRTEERLLVDVADAVVEELGPRTLIELGSGSSRKTQLLLDALRTSGGSGYVAFDVSDDALLDALRRLRAEMPWLDVHGVVGDFEHHLADLPLGDPPRLLVLLGGTIGNLDPAGQVDFLRQVSRRLVPGDGLLVGLDLVKDPAVLRAAYDDAAGVTAAFNRNVLRVLNRELDGDFPVEEFAHVARWNADEERIEMRLRSPRRLQVRLPGAGIVVPLDAGEEIRTELSCKFTRASATHRLEAAGLRLVRWDTDAEQRFALALTRAG